MSRLTFRLQESLRYLSRMLFSLPQPSQVNFGALKKSRVLFFWSVGRIGWIWPWLVDESFQWLPFYSPEGKADSTFCSVLLRLTCLERQTALGLLCSVGHSFLNWERHYFSDDMLRIPNAKGTYMFGVGNLRSDL